LKKNIYDRNSRSIVFWVNAVLLFVVFLVSAVSLLFIRKVLMENVQNMGEQIANSYAAEEEHNLEFYQSLINLGSQYMEGFIKDGYEEEFIDAWIRDYLDKVVEIAGEDVINPYAIVNGTVIAAKPWGDLEEYDAAQREWYQRAVSADGEVIFTDVYVDFIYHKPVITVAKECGETGNIIAFDIYPENFRVHINSQELPEGSFYFVCDSKGNLLYEENGSDADTQILHDGFHSLTEEIIDGTFQNGSEFYLAAEEKEMSVYYREEASGWISVLLIPNSFLLGNWETVIICYVIFVGVILAVFIFMWVRQRQINRDRQRINETVHILGNAYYAFYRVNINKGTYDMIKGSEYVRSKLPFYGDYQNLLNVFQDVIAEDTYEEFKESFSLENIHKQIENNVEDFGGDFLRLFGEEWKWVNVHIMFSPALNKEEAVLCFRHVEAEKLQQLRRMTLLKDSLKAANAGSQSQKKFFAAISHDMRTPLNVIIGMTEMAEENIGDREKVLKYLNKVDYSSRQLLGLINRILEMSRMEQEMPDGRNFDLCEKLDEIVGIFESQAEQEKKALDLICHVQHREVFGNSVQLEQIMNNLITNAFQFTESGGHICVELNEIENQEYTKYQIIVSDDGIGMTREVQEQIFLSSKQEKRFGAQNKDTFAMGLLIVRNLVSIMGGEIDVDSAVGKGTRVAIILPFDIAENVPKERNEEDDEARESCLKGKKILLVEDYELNMEMAADMLEMRGAQVFQAWNGKEAVEAFEASEPFFFDAVLMDMQMPIMDGCEAAKAIRSLERPDAGKVPIVAVTANAFAEDISRTIKAGMDGHIAKPINFKTLCNTLVKFWNKEK